MTKYIDADALLKGAILRVEGNFEYHGKKVPFSAIPEQTIRDCPSADVAEVVHGVWDDSYDGITPYCSVCKRSHRMMNRTPDYCPNCGAKMDGETICADGGGQ